MRASAREPLPPRSGVCVARAVEPPAPGTPRNAAGRQARARRPRRAGCPTAPRPPSARASVGARAAKASCRRRRPAEMLGRRLCGQAAQGDSQPPWPGDCAGSPAAKPRSPSRRTTPAGRCQKHGAQSGGAAGRPPRGSYAQSITARERAGSAMERARIRARLGGICFWHNTQAPSPAGAAHGRPKPTGRPAKRAPATR